MASLSFQQAAAYLLNGLDQSIDPCEDFYAFTCNKFIAQVNLTALGKGRLGTYDQAQVDVNSQIAATLKNVDVNDDKKFGGVPFLNQALKDNVDIFAAVGTIEQTHAVGTLMGSWVSVDYKNVAQNALYVSQVVISQPSYFAWLNAIFNGNTVDQNVIVNYIITQLLFDDFTFLGGAYRNAVQESGYVPYAQRRGRGVTRVGRRFARKFDDEDPAVGCMDMIMTYMPYGPGYVYVKSMEAVRDQVIKDITHQTDLVISNFQAMITTLDWMTPESKAAAKYKSDHILKNYGWPTALFGDFKDSTTVDAYHNADYFPIIAAFNLNKTDFYTIMNILKAGLENREAFRLLVAPDNKGDRSNFLQSPAMVNAWYQPERNSITFPYAIWNPPYYNLQYPQAYNYAGQGGTGGHELTHGFDDEGVQFGWDGTLTNCTWNQCGWMDTTSKSGFTDMAQCVVSQYSTQCCPEKTGNVHCANGATTQGENIADLGGQQAAYNAYQQYIKELGHEELRLPGLEQYSPNQIFWITYGYSWCMKQSDANLVNQLLTNPHAPGSCRTNQVMQDIPSFGKDFGCRQGSPMYPKPDQRCKVWVGY
ncbi:unnamed protein product [Haemonchus placei]|uniref:Peptidase_M13 domain-containing protein n=1 Tax=Haemonchus placei TaxID=6290 RepID=A0A158QRG5_HAEPC|nr:unnamed protein product [Haemonchus placei]